jgi:hypothetical protein
VKRLVAVALVLGCKLDGTLGRDGVETDTDLGTTACPLETDDVDCTDCRKRRCCGEFDACLSDPICACLEACSARGGADCAAECDGAGDATWAALATCSDSMCADRCP